MRLKKIVLLIAMFLLSLPAMAQVTVKGIVIDAETGEPIVEWQLSNDQYEAILELLEKATEPVMAQNISIGKPRAASMVMLPCMKKERRVRKK